ncbi:MAG: endonuclease MutS2 [Lactovum sp.]
MNKKIIDILEFKKVKELFSAFLSTAQGKNELSKLRIQTDIKKIKEEFLYLEEFQSLVIENGDLYFIETEDIWELLKRLEIKATLSAGEFLLLKKIVSSSIKIQNYFSQSVNVELSALLNIIEKLSDLTEINQLLSVFDDNGHLMDNASTLLLDLRRSIKRLESDIQKLMQQSLIKTASSLTESLITIRNDRQVLPVRADSKSKVAGIVHDISSSGQTLYIEPRAVVEKNNDLQQKKIEEKNEIVRIYALLSEKLSVYRKDIQQNDWVIGKLDFIRAKNEFLKREKASIPIISLDKKIELLQARHPLIASEEAVKNDLIFDKKLNTIVITGPNTGGKTITIKTLGLLTLMTQAGLPITAEMGSTVTIFKEIFADVGDEQSIEQSLSTFSGHMKHLIKILRKANEESLVLLDELGAGTDPKEGAALAKAILEELKLRNIKTLATTHYPELKAYALQTEAVMNASMEFDIEKMRPTYKLRLGIPGRSSAIEISKRLGLMGQVVEAARMEISSEEQDLESLIEHLENQVSEQEKHLEEIKHLKEEAEKTQKGYLKEKRAFEREKKQLLDKAQREAEEISAKAKLEVQKILKNLNEKMQLKPHEAIAAMSEIEQLVPDLSKNKVLKKAKAQRGLREGAEVLLTNFGQRGRLVHLEKDGRWKVSVGSVMATVSEEDIEVLQTVEEEKLRSKNIRRQVSHSVKAQLDLRGSRYEAASMEIDNYIDQALLANLGQITIVHGIGTGVIRDLVQKKLAQNKRIKDFEFAPMNAGGTGATIAHLK